MKNGKDASVASFAGKYGTLKGKGADISLALNDAGVAKLATYLKYDCSPQQQRFIATDQELAKILFGDLINCPLRASHPDHMAGLFGEHPEQNLGQSTVAYHEWVRLLETQVCVVWHTH